MHRSLAPLLAAILVAAAGSAAAHTLTPGRQVVETVGERALAYLRAMNGRPDVSAFAVEIYELDWQPAALAVASPTRLSVPASVPGDIAAVERTFSVLIDLGGQRQRVLRVCTKSLPKPVSLQAPVARLNTRVCSEVVARRFAP